MIHFKPITFGRPEKVTLLLFFILVAMTIAIATVPLVTNSYEASYEFLTYWAIRFGYAGAFFAALIGNLTVVVIFPYSIVIVWLASTGLDPFLLGLLTGLGAFIGEMSGYVLGRWGSTRFQAAKPAQYEALKKILNYRPRLVGWLLFIFSLTPMPDDVLFIPLGMLRYSIWKLIWPAVLGKVGAGLIITYSGSYVLRPLLTQPPTSLTSILGQVGSLVATLLVIYTIFKVDWTRTMHRLLKDEPGAHERAVS